MQVEWRTGLKGSSRLKVEAAQMRWGGCSKIEQTRDCRRAEGKEPYRQEGGRRADLRSSPGFQSSCRVEEALDGNSSILCFAGDCRVNGRVYIERKR